MTERQLSEHSRESGPHPIGHTGPRLELWKPEEERAKLGDGPWQEEPDKLFWVDEATGLDCMVVRGPMGALCGYVGVPPTHPWFMSDYDELPVNVHGGLTFAGMCHESDDGFGICHPEEMAACELVWWIGFDCAHSYDVVPGYSFTFSEPFPGASYRTMYYVVTEVRVLAKQVIEFMPISQVKKLVSWLRSQARLMKQSFVEGLE